MRAFGNIRATQMGASTNAIIIALCYSWHMSHKNDLELFDALHVGFNGCTCYFPSLWPILWTTLEPWPCSTMFSLGSTWFRFLLSFILLSSLIWSHTTSCSMFISFCLCFRWFLKSFHPRGNFLIVYVIWKVWLNIIRSLWISSRMTWNSWILLMIVLLSTIL